MNHSLTAHHGDVLLKPLSAEDSQMARIIRNRRSEGFLTKGEISSKQQEQWYNSYLTNAHDYMFAIYLDGEFAGQVGLYDINALTGECEFGRLVVDEKFSGRGAGYHATMAACQIAFDDLQLNRVKLEVLEGNTPAIKTYQKAGFVVVDEGSAPDGGRVLVMELGRCC